MKKVLKIGPLHSLNDLSKAARSGSLAIAYRKGTKINVQNIEYDPAKVSFDFIPEEDTLILKMRVVDGDFVVFANELGLAKKTTIDKT